MRNVFRCFLLEVVRLGEECWYRLTLVIVSFRLHPAVPCSRFPLDILPKPFLIPLIGVLWIGIRWLLGEHGVHIRGDLIERFKWPVS